MNGQRVSDRFERLRSQKIARELEHKHNLQATEYDKERPSAAPLYQQKISESEQVESPHNRIVRTIIEIGNKVQSMPDFILGVKQEGVEVEYSFRGENISLSYGVDGYAVKRVESGRPTE